MGLAAALLALIKAIPAAESLFAQVLALYSAWRKDENAKLQTAEAARDNAAIDAALLSARANFFLCDRCPFAEHGAGQHGGPDHEAGFPAGGSGGA